MNLSMKRTGVKNGASVRSLKQQSGMSMMLMLVLGLCAIFFGICAFKLVPIYAENTYVKNGLSSLVQLEDTEGGFATVSNAQIRTHLRNYFNLNNVDGAAYDSLEIDRLRNKFLVNMNYEVRTPLFYNINVVVEFKNQFDSSRPHDCCKPQSE